MEKQSFFRNDPVYLFRDILSCRASVFVRNVDVKNSPSTMFFFLLVFTLCWCFSCFSSVKGFVYPMWGEGHSQKQQGLEKNDDGWVAEFLMDYFVLPLKDGFCHVCSSFQEVYECIVRSELFE